MSRENALWWHRQKPGYYLLKEGAQRGHEAIVERGPSGWWHSVSWTPEGESMSAHFTLLFHAKQWAYSIAKGWTPNVEPGR